STAPPEKECILRLCVGKPWPRADAGVHVQRMFEMRLCPVKLAKRRRQHAKIAAGRTVANGDDAGGDRHMLIYRHQFVKARSGFGVSEEGGGLRDIGERRATLGVTRHLEPGFRQLSQTALRRLLKTELGGDQRKSRQPRRLVWVFINKALHDRRHFRKPALLAANSEHLHAI